MEWLCIRSEHLVLIATCIQFHHLVFVSLNTCQSVFHCNRTLLPMIEYVLAETLECLDQLARRMLMLGGWLVFQLSLALANNLHEDDYLAITMCVRAGAQGRLIPLITDLPRNEVPVFIVVLTTGSPGETLCSFFSTLLSSCYLFSVSWKVFS